MGKWRPPEFNEYFHILHTPYKLRKIEFTKSNVLIQEEITYLLSKTKLEVYVMLSFSRVRDNNHNMWGNLCQNIFLHFKSRQYFQEFHQQMKWSKVCCPNKTGCSGEQKMWHLVHTEWVTIIYTYRPTHIYIYPESILYNLFAMFVSCCCFFLELVTAETRQIL